jgi:D-alanyl-D-alanine carboxypeptidase/D-alanyl-D-alanine-endopeptidase (penicillin-binding protein 4)
MRRALAGCAVLAVALAAGATSAAAAPNPDAPARLPVARGAAATATASVSRSLMCSRAKARLRRATAFGGLFVIDADSGQTLCRRAGRTRRVPASNMKLFTTAAALGRLGADQQLQTSLWSVGQLSGGVLDGNLYLVGGGDPALSSAAFAKGIHGGKGTSLAGLVDAVEQAGIERVTGRVIGDDTIFDRRRGVADSHYATSPYLGPLSGLSFNFGYASSGRFAADPAKVAAAKLAAALRGAGVSVSEAAGIGQLPSGGGGAPRSELGAVESPRIEVLANETDIDSNNFFAEMLLKGLGARFGTRGSTRAGAKVSKRFARKLGTGARVVDGSGLSRGNRVTPAQVARLLVGMRRTDSGQAFVEALPLAGREGTVATRMRGTAAEGHCRTKTGTLTGVSALSGYCFSRSGHVTAFSILMNGVGSLYGARAQQDRIAALIARY